MGRKNLVFSLVIHCGLVAYVVTEYSVLALKYLHMDEVSVQRGLNILPGVFHFTASLAGAQVPGSGVR